MAMRISLGQLLCCTVSLTAMSAGTARAQDWGTIKKNTTLTRQLPPVVSLSGSSIAVTVATTPTANQAAAVAQQLRAKLVPLIFADKTLTEASANPNCTIEVTITDFEATSVIDLNDRTRRVAGSIKVAYRTIDNRTKGALDSKNLRFDYDRRFAPEQTAAQSAAAKKQGGVSGVLSRSADIMRKTSNAVEQAGGQELVEDAPTVPQLIAKLADGLAVGIAQRIVLTDEVIEVPLPRGGSLDKTMDLSRSKRWGAMLEQLDQMPPLAADKDAFRLYGMGVANEAMAYAEQSPANRRDLIASAAQNYKAARALRPNDNILMGAENRIAGSLAALDVTTAVRAPGTPVSTTGTTKANGAGETWDNAGVIEMVKSGFKDPELIEAIRAAKNAAFTVDSPRDLLQLKQAGVSDAVVRAMRQRMTAGKPQ